MKRLAGRGIRITGAVMVAASLAFGASQAFAAPAADAGTRGRACDPVDCRASCVAQGAGDGECHPFGCLCLY